MAYNNNKRRYQGRQTRSVYIRQKVEEECPQNEIRIRAKNSSRNYINRAAKLIFGHKEGEETIEKQDRIIISAISAAIPLALTTAELLRSRIPQLHQVTIQKQENKQEVYKPTEEGLDDVILTKSVFVFQIILTLNPTEEDKTNPSYIKGAGGECVQHKNLIQNKSRSGKKTDQNYIRNQRNKNQNSNPRNNSNRDQRQNSGQNNNSRQNRDNKDQRVNNNNQQNRSNRQGGGRREDNRDNRSNRPNYNKRNEGGTTRNNNGQRQQQQ